MSNISVTIHNPLPLALAHYEEELSSVLHAAGTSFARTSTPSIEGGRSKVLKIARWLMHIARLRLRCRGSNKSIELIIWPPLGFYDIILLWFAGVTAVLIIHDPEPLRPQVGLSRRAGQLAGFFAKGSRCRVLVHSSNASDILGRLGIVNTSLPHPLVPCEVRPPSLRAARATIRVLGQFKSARDLAALDAIAQWSTTNDSVLEILGRGWPEVPGWKVASSWLTEEAFMSMLQSADVIVIPYKKFFQSGVAIRALEAGVPVVGQGDWFSKLWGETWPGLVTDENWAAAVVRLLVASEEDLKITGDGSFPVVVDSWRGWFDSLNGPPAVW